MKRDIWIPKCVYEPTPYAAMAAGAATAITNNWLLITVGAILFIYGFVIFGYRVQYREGWIG